MSNSKLNEWEETFIEFLDLTEFTVEKENDYFLFLDRQNDYCGNKEYHSAKEIFDDISFTIEDYIIESLNNCLDYYEWNKEYPQTYQEWLTFRKKHPMNIICTECAFEFKCLDMIVNHCDDIDLNNII